MEEVRQRRLPGAAAPSGGVASRQHRTPGTGHDTGALPGRRRLTSCRESRVCQRTPDPARAPGQDIARIIPRESHLANPRISLAGCRMGCRGESSNHPRRRHRRPVADPSPPRFKLGGQQNKKIASRRSGDNYRLLENALLEGHALRRGGCLPIALFFRLLLLAFGNRLAHAAGVSSVEGLCGTFDEAVLRRIIGDHLRPRHHLQHTPVAAAKMQAAKHGDDDAHVAVQDPR
jgi:hypothetical protein